MIELMFLLTCLAIIVVGFGCTVALCGERPLWVRLVVLSPAFASMFAVYGVSTCSYVPYPHDVVFQMALLALYALVASRFTKHPWLDIKKVSHG
jgi:hypothetical protein